MLAVLVQEGVGLTTVTLFYVMELLLERLPALTSKSSIQQDLSSRLMTLHLASTYPLTYFLVANLLTGFVNLSLRSARASASAVGIVRRLHYLIGLRDQWYYDELNKIGKSNVQIALIPALAQSDELVYNRSLVTTPSPVFTRTPSVRDMEWEKNLQWVADAALIAVVMTLYSVVTLSIVWGWSNSCKIFIKFGLLRKIFY